MSVQKIMILIVCAFSFIGNMSAVESDNELLNRLLGYIRKSNITGVEQLVNLQRDRFLPHAAVLRRAAQDASGQRLYESSQSFGEFLPYMYILVAPFSACFGAVFSMYSKFHASVVPEGKRGLVRFVHYAAHHAVRVISGACTAMQIGLCSISALALSSCFLYLPFYKYANYRHSKYCRVRDFIDSRFPQNIGNRAAH